MTAYVENAVSSVMNLKLVVTSVWTCGGDVDSLLSKQTLRQLSCSSFSVF
jgi:hypothetical protein